jgi:hypothetical protein
VVVFHKLKTEKNLICIAREDKKVVVSVHNNTGESIQVLRNLTLLDESDVDEETVRLEQFGNGFKIYFEYPKNIYLVGFDADAKHVAESYVLIKLDAVAPDSPPQLISLVVDSKQLAGLNFETLTKEQVFDKSLLDLEKPLNARITAQRAQVSYFPNGENFSDKYLVKGDSVNVIDFKNGWIKVQYETPGCPENNGWVLLADIL